MFFFLFLYTFLSLIQRFIVVIIPFYEKKKDTLASLPSSTAESPLQGTLLFGGSFPDLCASKNIRDFVRASL